MIVLDTHIWLWWVNDDALLKAEWREIIESASEVGVSAISCFEVAWLERHNRIVLPHPRSIWLEKALDGSGITLLPVSAEIATTAVDLPEHHSDPQDRIIIATALVLGGQLISADRKFPLYHELAGKLVL
ncbi:MAG: type II toxin-antitoxin system VapC family toxin [Methylococcaceae bacterium]|nr:type II toxin-antitoxin system VapC family toxin [Methylococcaceae bacterium]MDZ4155019.1 type II toxin-antitoxin system VapC family toxin [Methylococcales bacterium]MDP2394536.1 type II toxin-antitoxin system VapC family toxin [Methylococcaceae bacterium]MDP3021580.1 type II toxin-antitoxin system VapC family toxin [Methylococcaceae bacterium]MDP3392079.1 type II toxin-antitoxin system VapC family toxin [Methylococcaceae bacterium]